MKFISLFIFLVVTFAGASKAHAGEKIRWHDEAAGAQFWILHDEGAAYSLDHFFKPRDGFQRMDSSRSFRSAASAEAAFTSATRNFSAYKPAWIDQHPLPRTAPVPIWETKNEWSEDWEAKFHAWVKATATPEYLKANGVATDCADVAYSYRWIFARLNGLPAAAHLAGTNDLLSNDAGLAEWSKLPTNDDWAQDQRFLAALNYTLDQTYTHTLMNDSYPIAIRAGSLDAGTYFLNLWSTQTGHTELIREFLGDPTNPEPLQMMASDVPRALRVLSAYGFRVPPQTNLTLGHAAFLSFLWPVKNADGSRQLADPKSMPDYSLEQFDPGFTQGSADFAEAVIRHLMPNWSPDAGATMKALLSSLATRWADRANIVAQGIAYCAKNPCGQGTAGWENWGTFARDAATGEIVQELVELRDGYNCGLGCKWAYYGQGGQTVAVVNAHNLAMSDAIEIWQKKSYSSDPTVSAGRRWGIK